MTNVPTEVWLLQFSDDGSFHHDFYHSKEEAQEHCDSALEHGSYREGITLKPYGPFVIAGSGTVWKSMFKETKE